MTSRIIVTYANVNDPKDTHRLYILEGQTVNKDVEEKVLASKDYEMVRVRIAGEKPRRFDLDYPEVEEVVPAVEAENVEVA